MKIIIPTRGRVGKLFTLRKFSEKALENTVLVVPQDEKDKHNFPNVVAVPNSVTNLTLKRKWIMENFEDEKIVQMDDDLYFNVRKDGKLGVAESEDIDEMLEVIEQALDHYAHVGVSQRANNNREIKTYRENTRMTRVLAYNRPIFIKEVELDRDIITCQDFEHTLQLLRKGYKNLVLYKWAQNHPGTGTAGGCSIYRSPEVQREGALKLQRYHQQFIDLKEKHYRSAVESMQNRLEATIFWKKAFKEGENLFGAKPDKLPSFLTTLN